MAQESLPEIPGPLPDLRPPDGYTLIGYFDLARHRHRKLLFAAGSLLIFPMAWLFLRLALALRPELAGPGLGKTLRGPSGALIFVAILLAAPF